MFSFVFLQFRKVGITDKPSFTVDVRYNTENHLNLKPSQGYNGTIHSILTYRSLNISMDPPTILYPSFQQRRLGGELY